MARQIRTVKLWWLVIIAAIFAALGWIATLLTNRGGWPTPALPYSALITLVLAAVVVFALGWRVRSWRNGNRQRELNPILAARTLILAQASAYAGSVIFGWHLGVGIDALTAVSLGAPLNYLGMPAALAGGSLIVVVVGLMVERFCQLPPEDRNPDNGTDTGESGREFAS